MVLALLLVLIGFGIATAALTTTLSSRTNADRDERSKRAQQAADAGIQTALYRANQTDMSTLQLSSGLSLSSIIKQLLVCPIPQVNASGQISSLTFTAVASAGNPCPSNSSSGTGSPFGDSEPVGHHAWFQVQYDPGLTNIGDFVEFKPTIVSDGFDNNGQTGSSGQYVSQRVEAILSSFMPWRTLEAAHNLTFDVPPALSALGLKVAGTTVFNGTAAAGNNLTLDGQSLVNTFQATGISLSNGLTTPTALDYCNALTKTNIQLSLTLGNITKPSSGCSDLVNRSTVQISSTKADCAPTTGTVSCGTLFNSSVYSSTTDSIYCTSSCPALTFQPGDYVFCDFQYNGSVSLNAASTQAVRIFIDNPNSSRCSGITGSHSGSQPTGFQSGYGNFVATHGVANLLGATHPSQAQVYVVGNGSNDGTVAYATGDSSLFGSLGGEYMFLYAPTSNVTVTGGQSCVTVLGTNTCVNAGTLSGAFIGYDVDASATAITEDLGLLNYPLSSTLGPFHVKQYIECSPAYPLPSTATSGC
jgi:type II secretory pathway pseudopilin PulG